MFYKSTILLASISLGLVACGGGGGGGGTTSTTTTETPKTKHEIVTSTHTPNGIPVLRPAEGSKRVGYLHAEYTQENMPEPPEQYTPANFKYNKYIKAVLPDGRLEETWVNVNDDFRSFDLHLVDGKPWSLDDGYSNTSELYVDADNKDNMTSFLRTESFTFNDKDGISYAGYQFYEDPALSYELKAHEPGSHRWTSVLYQTNIAQNGKRPENWDPSKDDRNPYAYDGTITVNGDKWDAVFGDVTLDGKISGTEVSGTATGKFYGQTLKGEFAGYDGTSRPKGSDKTYQPGTVGGYVGQSDTAVFSGTWTNNQSTEFLQ